MCYGITSSGKTYTIEGNQSQPGVLPRALQYLCDHIHDSESESKNENEKREIVLSHYEVYNDHVYDLLSHYNNNNTSNTNDSEKDKDTTTCHNHSHYQNHNHYDPTHDVAKKNKKVALKVMEDHNGTINVCNLSRIVIPHYHYGMSLLGTYLVTILIVALTTSISLSPLLSLLLLLLSSSSSSLSFSQCQFLLRLSGKSLGSRFNAATCLNQHSSRSHSVVTIRIVTKKTDNNASSSKSDDQYSEITFVDLAGIILVIISTVNILSFNVFNITNIIITHHTPRL